MGRISAVAFESMSRRRTSGLVFYDGEEEEVAVDLSARYTRDVTEDSEVEGARTSRRVEDTCNKGILFLLVVTVFIMSTEAA